ncbi:DNA-binding MurR/RpiR family transcriptional regulator [Bacillus pakistanensis]|uniref:DNA-binding MurR/RpiR family transcriptional regulator n=1 Tax=Rossellomorea pakistanensis TaxID=992288 RepID=A0ABS2NEL9_9BACI|nr:MurR/RpiR family transcriptional regulator [Bacillus pakistanensis]MBM7586287.1 DNA-binding MurR/RpiR family transcriptional regulator [Bacillus pakistanensis]
MKYLGKNLMNSIEMSLETFTQTEVELAQYILKYPEEASRLSISQIAKKLHLSPATITRFSQKLSFSGFNEFKHELKRYVDLNRVPSEHTDIKQMEHFAKLYHNYQDIIDNTFRVTEYKRIQRAVELLNEARKIQIYGLGSSGIAAHEFQVKFFRVGLPVEAITDPHLAVMNAALCGEDSVIIGISISGETNEVIRAVKVAKRQGAKVIVFTGTKGSTLSQVGDISLQVASKNNMYLGQNISPLLPLLLLFDLLYTELVSNDYKNRLQLRENTLKALFDRD